MLAIREKRFICITSSGETIDFNKGLALIQCFWYLVNETPMPLNEEQLLKTSEWRLTKQIEVPR